MFLVRSAFLLALLVMILPSDPREQARMYQTASYALHRAATFCERNQGICDEGRRHWAAFQDKAAIGARMAGDLITERLAGSPAAPLDAGPPLLERTLPASDTLRPSDRAPEWRLRTRAQL